MSVVFLSFFDIFGIWFIFNTGNLMNKHNANAFVQWKVLTTYTLIFNGKFLRSDSLLIRLHVCVCVRIRNAFLRSYYLIINCNWDRYVFFPVIFVSFTRKWNKEKTCTSREKKKINTPVNTHTHDFEHLNGYFFFSILFPRLVFEHRSLCICQLQFRSTAVSKKKKQWLPLSYGRSQ